MFKRNKSHKSSAKNTESQAVMAEAALKAIDDGVIMTDQNGVICFINPAAVLMTESGSVEKTLGLDYGFVIKLQSKEGRELTERDNPLIQAMKAGRPLEPMQAILITGQSGKPIPVSIAMLLEEGTAGNRVITFRDITKELEEEGEQTEFISTASHEMRTPVATIDGYLALCLNPQTATIDERARGYLAAAQAASKHLGKLFHDLLDVTKLDDGRIRPHFEPVEMIELVKNITDDYIPRAKEAKITFNFGSSEPVILGGSHRMEQVVYGYIDVNFMREILDNLIENALKYTPEGGSIYVNVRGDGDRILLNVTDTGIGISADDLAHIFQKFYRVDNSDTREVGGTGLGLYITKQRVEAMGGKIWAESAFGEGSTFYVSLPRITSNEYEKRMIAVRNQQLQPQDPVNKEAPKPGSVADMIKPQTPPPFQPQSFSRPQPQSTPALVQPQVITSAGTQPQPSTQIPPSPQPQPQSQIPPQPQPSPQPQQTPQPQSSPQLQLHPRQSVQAPPGGPPQSTGTPSPQIPSLPPKPPISPPTPASQPVQPVQLTQTIRPTQPIPPTQPIGPKSPIQPVQNQINNNLNGDTK